MIERICVAESWKTCVMAAEASIRDAIAVIDRGGWQIALVADAGGRLLGVLTDGDIRRAILRGIPLDNAVDQIMNRSPQTGHEDWTRDRIAETIRSHKIRQLPLLDDERRVVNLVTVDDLIAAAEVRQTWVVLMAGGLGTRLRPLTEALPKPMLDLGGRPILERILSKFIDADFRNFFISVNYRADMIKSHFGDGSRHGVTIRYLDESEPLGTAGALSLLPGVPGGPFVVMNGDLLTDVNPSRLLDFHADRGAVATVAVREYEIEVPFGVVETGGVNPGSTEWITTLREKPVHRFLVNAGIYVLNPEALSKIVAGKPLDMPNLLSRLIENGGKVAAFPIHEAWTDVGRIDDLQKARREFGAQ